MWIADEVLHVARGVRHVPGNVDARRDAVERRADLALAVRTPGIVWHVSQPYFATIARPRSGSPPVIADADW